jgi:hypothetical protein
MAMVYDVDMFDRRSCRLYLRSSPTPRCAVRAVQRQARAHPGEGAGGPGAAAGGRARRVPPPQDRSHVRPRRRRHASVRLTTDDQRQGDAMVVFDRRT